jgi:hypothetical protein
MNSKPSLVSMFGVIVGLAKKEGYKAPEQIEAGGEIYKTQREEKKIDTGTPNDIPSMGNGESVLIGSTIFQKGGGFMGGKNQYDRYTIFSIHPSAHYLITQWPMGLIQVSGNPFSPLTNNTHLGDLVMKNVMPAFKSKLEAEKVSLDRVKYTYERDIAKKSIEGAVGFNWKDFVALFDKQIQGLGSEKWDNMVQDISDKPYASLSKKQRDIIGKIYVSAWDLIMASSGGHKNITNMSGFNFLKDTKGIMNDISVAIAKLMKDKKMV